MRLQSLSLCLFISLFVAGCSADTGQGVVDAMPVPQPGPRADGAPSTANDAAALSPPTPPPCPAGGCSGPRVGDTGSVPRPAAFDPAFPDMETWANAGVRGGIPDVDVVERTLMPGASRQEIQAAIDALALSKPTQRPAAWKVVLLKKGRYGLDGGTGHEPIIRVKPGVILRGEDRAATVLSFMRANAGPEYDFSIQVDGWAGLETLTVTNQFVEKQPEASYVGKYENPPAAPGSTLSGVRVSGSDAWVQGIHVVKIGTHPMVLMQATHCTLRDNIIEKAYNKGGGGRGYYYLWESSHNLLYRETVRDIRHINFSASSDYNVFLEVQTSVDLNPHNRTVSHNLFEGVRSTIPSSHQWGKGARRGFHPYTGTMTMDNLVYRMSTFDDDRVYRAFFTPGDGGAVKFEPLANGPRGGTLYAVTGWR